MHFGAKIAQICDIVYKTTNPIELCFVNQFILMLQILFSFFEINSFKDYAAWKKYANTVINKVKQATTSITKSYWTIF